MIDLEDGYLRLVREILRNIVPSYEVRLFGSRARGNAVKYSDIDLILTGRDAVPEEVLSRLKEAFSASDLPYRVDVLDWNALSMEFRKAVQNQGFEIIQNGNIIEERS